jgi:hypothetical protein
VSRPLWYAVVVLVALAACSRAEDEGKGKRTPSAPPPVDVKIPAGLAIPVTVDGAAHAPIDAAVLAAHRPDFQDEDRRAWKLVTLVPELDRDGARVEAVGQQGIRVQMARPPGAAGPQPVLFLTRRGDVVATLVDPAQPFPDYHGQGGRLRRPGDTMPHVTPVLELAVVTHR